MLEWFLSSAVLTLIVILLRLLLKGKISLRLQYALWALVLVRLLVPVSIGSTSFSIGNLSQRAAGTEVGQKVTELSDAKLPGKSYQAAYDEVAREYAERGVDISALPVKTEPVTPEKEPKEPTEPITDLSKLPAAELAETVDYEIYSRMNSTWSVRDVLLAVWIAGAAVVGLVLLASNLRFAAKLKKTRKRLAGQTGTLPVYVSRAAETPCLLGVFRPKIYLMGEATENTTILRHSIEHETTHYRHGDHIWAILRGVCLALHWFDPLVWWAAVLSRNDAELACDEATIRRLGEQERTEYGRTLIQMTCQRRPALLLTATTMTGSKNSIKERIWMIAKKPKAAIYTLIAVLLIVSVAAGCAFTGAEDTDTPDTTDPKPAETTVATTEATTTTPATTTEPATTTVTEATTTEATTTATTTEATTTTEAPAAYPASVVGDDEKACYDMAVDFLNRTTKLEWSWIPCDLTEFFYPTVDSLEARAQENFYLLAEVTGHYRAAIGRKRESTPVNYTVTSCETDNGEIVMAFAPDYNTSVESPIPGILCTIRFAKHVDKWLIRTIETVDWCDYENLKYDELDADAILDRWLDSHELQNDMETYLNTRDLEHWSGPLAPAIDFSVRGSLRIWEGELTEEQIASVTTLTLQFLSFDDWDDWDRVLEGLELCTGVRTLYMENYLGESLEFLHLVPQLQLLSMRKQNSPTETVYDLTPLADLTELTRLELMNYRIKDLSPIGSLTALRELWIERSGSLDLSPLSTLTDLRVLTLDPVDMYEGDDSKITRLAALGNMGKLSCLRIRNGVGDFSVLAELPLVGLSMTGCTVNSYAYLPKTLETLFTLESGYKDTDIPYLAKLPKLKYLFVDVCEDENALLALGLDGCIAPGVGALTDRYEYPGPYNTTLLLDQMDWTSPIPGVE